MSRVKMVDSNLIEQLENKGYTKADIAKKLYISHTTITIWANQNKIPYNRIQQLEDLLKSEEQSPLKEFTIEELVKELASRSFKVHLEWIGGF